MTIKRLWKSFKQTLLCGAMVHLFLLAVYSVMSGDWTYMGMASIFDLKLFFPSIDYGSLLVLVLSSLPLVILFVVQYIRNGVKSGAANR